MISEDALTRLVIRLWRKHYDESAEFIVEKVHEETGVRVSKVEVLKIKKNAVADGVLKRRT